MPPSSCENCRILRQPRHHGEGHAAFLPPRLIEERIGSQTDWNAVDTSMLKAGREGCPLSSRATVRGEDRRRTQERSSRWRYARRAIGTDQGAVDKARAAHRPGSDVRAGGVENGGRLDRGEFNDRAQASISARTIRRSTRQVPCMMATNSAIALPSSTAMSARSKCSVAPTPRRGRFLVTSTRMHAIWHAD